MSWGNKLMLVFIAFAALITTLVYKAVNTKFELVSKDYYKDELRFQDQIDAAKNSAAIANVIFSQNESSVYIQFPPEFNTKKIDAKIWFYCKADGNRDKKFEINTSSASVVINKKQIFKGNFEIKITWFANGKNFYNAESITVL